MKTKADVIITTPIGRGKHVWLNKPDTAFNGEKYKTKLMLDVDEAKPLVDKLHKAAQELYGDKASEAKLGFSTDIDTGELILQAQTKFEPKFFDSQGNPIPKANVPELYGGSKMALKVKLFPYNMGATNYGISLQIMAVQIVDPVTSRSMIDASDFNTVDGGFVAEDTSFETAGMSSASNDGLGEASYLD